MSRFLFKNMTIMQQKKMFMPASSSCNKSHNPVFFPSYESICYLLHLLFTRTIQILFIWFDVIMVWTDNWNIVAITWTHLLLLDLLLPLCTPNKSRTVGVRKDLLRSEPPMAPMAPSHLFWKWTWGKINHWIRMIVNGLLWRDNLDFSLYSKQYM